MLLSTFWLFSCGSAFYAGSGLYKASRSVAGPSAPGWACLTMPVPAMQRGSALAGWDRLRVPALPEPEAPATDLSPMSRPSVLEEPPEVASERRVFRLHGIVDQGAWELYCFHDTREDRWIRLRPGHPDPASGLLLEVNPGGGGAVLKDAETGQPVEVTLDFPQLMEVQP